MYSGLTCITLGSSILIIDTFFRDIAWEDYITISFLFGTGSYDRGFAVGDGKPRLYLA